MPTKMKTIEFGKYYMVCVKDNKVWISTDLNNDKQYEVYGHHDEDNVKKFYRLVICDMKR